MKIRYNLLITFLIIVCFATGCKNSNHPYTEFYPGNIELGMKYNRVDKKVKNFYKKGWDISYNEDESGWKSILAVNNSTKDTKLPYIDYIYFNFDNDYKLITMNAYRKWNRNSDVDVVSYEMYRYFLKSKLKTDQANLTESDLDDRYSITFFKGDKYKLSMWNTNGRLRIDIRDKSYYDD